MKRKWIGADIWQKITKTWILAGCSDFADHVGTAMTLVHETVYISERTESGETACDLFETLVLDITPRELGFRREIVHA